MQHPSDLKRRIAAAAAALLAAAFAASGALAAEDSAEKASDSTKQCLMCHGGSFEALREQTKNWTDEFGDKIQPHQYLDSESANPHQGAKVVPECTNCHEKHPVPLPAGYKPKQATFSTCYGCHHMENFQKCSDAGCHANGH